MALSPQSTRTSGYAGSFEDMEAKPSRRGTLRSRRKSMSEMAGTPFAGRIGANQEYVADPDDSAAHSLLEMQPDAAPLRSIKQSLDLRGFFNVNIWRMALIEGFATCLWIFVLGGTASGLSIDFQSNYANTIYSALINFLGLSLFIFAAAPATGGHVNPTITMATFFAGLSTLPRTVLYIAAQSTGAIIGGYWLRLALGDAYFPKGVIPGCTVDTKLVSIGEMFVLEFFFDQIIIFTSFGVGLDPRQAQVFGAALAPLLVGASLGLGTLVSGIAKPGYGGMCFNPARCLGLMVAKNELQHHYIHWLAPLAASIVNGIFYFIAPPYMRDTPLMLNFSLPKGTKNWLDRHARHNPPKRQDVES